MQTEKESVVGLKDKDWLRCSFCKKHASEVAQLIAGPHVHICNACVDLCRLMLEQEYPEYKPLNDVQLMEIPAGPLKVSEVVALLAKFHFDTRVEISVEDSG